MARNRLVHLGTAALLSAAVMTVVGIAGSVMAQPQPQPMGSVWVPIVPCRLMDTRAAATVGTRHTPLGAAETATVTVAGANGTCVIPLEATGITANITATNTTATSFLTVFPAFAAQPDTSNLNWKPQSQPVANNLSISLSPASMPNTLVVNSLGTGSIDLFNSAGTVDVIIDISGYYEASAGGAPGPQGAQGVQGEQGQNGVGDLGCTVDQTIKWSGEAWACTDQVVDTDTLAAMDCTVNQSIRWSGSAWECRSEPIVATLSRVAGRPGFDAGLTNVFQAYSPNVDTNYPCDSFFCSVHLVDVVDHTSCQVSFTGNSQASMIDVVKFTDHIDINFIYDTNHDQPLYVNLSCTA